MARHRGHGFARDPMWPGINDLPWDEDDIAWYMVATVGEMSLEQVGECFGCTKERARQIEVSAKKKVEKEIRKLGYGEVDVAELLSSIGSAVVYPSTIDDGNMLSDEALAKRAEAKAIIDKRRVPPKRKPKKRPE